MYTGREIKTSIVFAFAWRLIVFYFVYSFFLCAVAYWLDISIGISFVPIGLIGTAVAFYVGFKNNSSYERLWEARRIWGSLVNASRTWGAFVMTYISTSDNFSDSEKQAVQTKLIHGHIAYVNSVRVQLRQKSMWNDSATIAHEVVRENHAEDHAPLVECLNEFLEEKEVKYFLSKKNPATHIMKLQAAQLDEVFKKKAMNDLSYFHMMGLVQEFYNQQGAAERIKGFPFPRQYAYFSKVFVWLFILVLPFGLITEFAKLGGEMVWMAVPCYMIIAWVFQTMEIVGDTSENPFENAINDVPMTAICRTIEIDLREMLEEKVIPPALVPVNNILM